MAAAVRLSDAIEQHLASLAGMGRATNTRQNRKWLLLQLLGSVGNIYTKNLRPEHIDRFFTENPEWQDSTRAQYAGSLGAFQTWMWARRLLSRDIDLLEAHRSIRPAKRARPRVPAELSAVLVGTPESPRDRIVLALGLYLMARSSELVTIKWKDVNLTPGEESIYYYRQKTKQDDEVAMFDELVEEMHRWRRFVCKKMGVTAPDPEWYVICQMARPRARNNLGHYVAEEHIDGVRLLPDRPLLHPVRRIKRALQAVGVDEPGTGMHTLRRSGAQAMLDSLEARGIPGAMSIVKDMLGHADERQTAVYLDRSAARRKRDALIRGHRLTPRGGGATEGNVVPLRRR